jgi:hypothetical protein
MFRFLAFAGPIFLALLGVYFFMQASMCVHIYDHLYLAAGKTACYTTMTFAATGCGTIPLAAHQVRMVHHLN